MTYSSPSATTSYKRIAANLRCRLVVPLTPNRRRNMTSQQRRASYRVSAQNMAATIRAMTLPLVAFSRGDKLWLRSMPQRH